MLELRSSTITAQFHPTGARIASCVVDGVETAFGCGSDHSILSGDIFAGAICGRHAGRISNSSFTLDGQQVLLKPNHGAHQLHGGDTGFHARHWDYIRDANRITFMLQSADGEEGFPGHLSVKAVYALVGNVLSLDLSAETTKPTLCNLTNHAYWNVAGSNSILAQQLQIHGAQYFPLDDSLLPVGRMEHVADTPMDFRKARVIAGDYDNAILLDGAHGTLKPALTLRDPDTRRAMDVWTTERCVQFYTAQHWNSEMMGHMGPLVRSQALAVEPQCVADSINHVAFPQTILRSGEIYRNRIEWRFS
jgi:aldose 1-epimerase